MVLGQNDEEPDVFTTPGSVHRTDSVWLPQTFSSANPDRNLGDAGDGGDDDFHVCAVVDIRSFQRRRTRKKAEGPRKKGKQKIDRRLSITLSEPPAVRPLFEFTNPDVIDEVASALRGLWKD